MTSAEREREEAKARNGGKCWGRLALCSVILQFVPYDLHRVFLGKLEVAADMCWLGFCAVTFALNTALT